MEVRAAAALCRQGPLARRRRACHKSTFLEAERKRCLQSACSPELLDNSSATEKSLSISDYKSDSSSEPSDKCGPGAANVKVGFDQPGEKESPSRARLSDILKMKNHGLEHVGSCHAYPAQCSPCNFHFSHLRWPDTRSLCKAKFLCEYCYNESQSEMEKHPLKGWAAPIGDVL